MRDVTGQPFEALLLFHGGTVTGLLYLLLRIVRNRIGKRWITHLCDAVFVLLSAAVFAGYVYLANYGSVRGFLVVAYLMGFAAFYALFNALFARISQKIRKK